MEGEDIFGGKISDLFDEFEKDRISTGSFITYDKNEDGEEVRSKIIFNIGDSDSSLSDSESDNDEPCATRVNAENESGLETRTIVAEDDNITCEKGKAAELDSIEKKFVNGSTAYERDNSLEEDIADNSIHTGTESEKIAHTTNFKLLHERNKFCRYSRLIDSTRSVQDGSPGVQILFQNNSFSRKYRTQIEQYICWLLQQEAQEDTGERLPRLPLKASALTCVDLNSKLPAEKRNDQMWREHAIIGCAQFHREFLVDPLGWPLIDNNPALTDGWEVPAFEQMFMDPLPVKENDAPEKRQERQKASCFNCGGDHILGECKLPRDFQKINQNRAAFAAQQNSSPAISKPRSARYHKEVNNEERFLPGVISDELREALGLSKDQLPSYIYRMRLMGYPPGWLQEAQPEESGLALFDKHGKAVKVETEEDGEIDDGSPQPPGQINVDKIIEYPGFTITPPSGTIDEWQKLRMPPMQDHQLKTTLKKQTENVEASKRKRDDYEEERSRKRAKIENDRLPEMEIDDDGPNRSPVKSLFIPPLPIDTPPSRPPLPDGTPPATPPILANIKYHPTMGNLTPSPGSTPRRSSTPDSRKMELIRQLSNTGSIGSSGRGSPSLEDLEEQYQLLQQKLSEAEVGSDTQLIVLDSCSDDESKDREKNGGDKDIMSAVKPKLARNESSASIQSFGELGRGTSLPGTPDITPSASFSDLNFAFKASESVSKEFGTPITSRSGFDSLPDSDNFQGICDHIPFENLPDATGTFEKMRNLLMKIREKVPKRKKKL